MNYELSIKEIIKAKRIKAFTIYSTSECVMNVRISRHDFKNIQTASLGFKLWEEKLIQIMSTQLLQFTYCNYSLVFAMKDNRLSSGPECTA